MKWLLPFALLVAAPAYAEVQGSAIAAVVNDEVVSTLDLESRVQLVIATSSLTDTPEVRERLRPQILRSLLDEKLQMQEMTRNGISVTPQDLEEAMAAIEQQRNMPPGSLLSTLDSIGAPRESFLEQIRAQVGWSKLVLKTLRPKIRVSDDEVERERGKARAGGGVSEVKIEVLGLPVERPQDEQQVKALAEKLASEIRSGAPFESVARGLGSEKSSEPFWVPLTDLDPAMARAVEKTEAGTVTEPVRTLEGYALVKLLDRRAGESGPVPTEVVVKDILLKLKFDADREMTDLMLNIGRDVAKNPGTCSEEGIAGVKNVTDYDIVVTFRREMLTALAPQLRGIVDKLGVGGVSEPYASREGIRLFMLCERVEKPGPLADREETVRRLQQQKLELEVQKYIRTLRRDASVEIRL